MGLSVGHSTVLVSEWVVSWESESESGVGAGFGVSGGVGWQGELDCSGLFADNVLNITPYFTVILHWDKNWARAGYKNRHASPLIFMPEMVIMYKLSHYWAKGPFLQHKPQSEFWLSPIDIFILKACNRLCQMRKIVGFSLSSFLAWHHYEEEDSYPASKLQQHQRELETPGIWMQHGRFKKLNLTAQLTVSSRTMSVQWMSSNANWRRKYS